MFVCRHLMNFDDYLIKFDDLLSKFDESNQMITVTGLVIPGINQVKQMFTVAALIIDQV